MSKQFAVINNNIVENIIIADTLEIAEVVTGKTCVEYNDNNPAGIGWTYDGEKFVAPKPEGE
jgi:hypothetical protein